jgi:hypothetical protein
MDGTDASGAVGWSQRFLGDRRWSRFLAAIPPIIVAALIVAAVSQAFAEREVDRNEAASATSGQIGSASDQPPSARSGGTYPEADPATGGPSNREATADGSGRSPLVSTSRAPVDGEDETTTSTAPTTTTRDPSSTTAGSDESTTTAAETTTTSSSTTGSTEPETAPPAPTGPSAGDDAVTTKAGKEVKIAVLDNDREAASGLDRETLSIVASPTLAEEYRVHGDHLHYRAADDVAGVDTLRYRICDEGGRCAEAVVVVTVE